MIKLIKIEKQIRGKKILNEISLELPDSGMILINGKNGSGKTTLLNIIGGLDIPSSGEIWIDKKRLSLEEKELCKYREENISYIFQDNNLFDNLSVEENINIVGKSEEYETIVKELKIDNLLEQKARNLSGGERQRVAIVRAIVKSSKIILADEPTASIDKESKHIILEKLKELSKYRLVILVSHDKIEIPNFADMTVNLDQGRLNIERDFSSKCFKPMHVNSYSNNFNFIKFTFKNFFVNKKLLIRNGIILIFLIFFLIISLLISFVDILDVHIDTLLEEKDKAVKISKQRQLEDSSWVSDINGFLEEDIKFLNSLGLSESYVLEKTISDNYEPVTFEIPYLLENTFLISMDRLSYVSDMDIDPDFGSSPTSTNEVVISSYLADCMIEFGVMNAQNELFYPNNYEDLLKNANLLKLGVANVKIVGIYNLDLSKFKDIKQNSLEYEYFKKYLSMYANIIYVSNNFYTLFDSLKSVLYPDTKIYALENEITYYINNFSTPVLLIDQTYINELGNNEVIIGRDIKKLLKLSDDCVGKNISFTVDSNFIGNKKELSFKVVGMTNDEGIYLNENSLKDFYYKNIVVNNILVSGSNKKDIKKIFDTFPNSYGKYVLSTNFSEKYYIMEIEIKVVKIVLYIFSAILIFLIIMCILNFLYDSVDVHKNDIVILKSLGINDKQIMYSFLVESFIVLLISYLMSLVISYPTQEICNTYFSSKMGFKCNIILSNNYVTILLGIVLLIVYAFILFCIFNRIKKITPIKILEKSEL